MRDALGRRPCCCAIPLHARAGAADLQVRSGDLRVETIATRPCQSMGPRLPAGRPHAGDRAARPHAHRRARRHIVAAARRRAEGRRHQSGRAARRRARSRLREKQHDLFLLFRSGAGRRADRAGARAARCRRRRRGSSTSSASSSRRARPRADCISAAASRRRATAICFSPPATITAIATGADARQSSRQGDPHRARRLGAEGQSVRRQAGRQAGNLELRPSQQSGRAHPSRDRQAVDARTRSARRRRDQHSGSRQELRLAGDRLSASITAAPKSTKARRRPAWSSRSGNGRR